MKKRTKWILLISAGVFLCLMITLPIGILFYLESNHFQGFIQNKINASIPGNISWKTFHFSLITGKLELTNALLKGPSDDRLAGFDRLFLDLSLKTLLQRTLTLAQVTLEGPWTNLHTDKEGNLNLTKAFPPSSPEKEETPKQPPGDIPINIAVKELKIVDGSFHFEREADVLKAELQGINLTGETYLPRSFLRSGDGTSGNLDFQIAKGKVESPQLNTDLDQFHIQTTLQDGQADPILCQISTTPLRLNLTGNVHEVFKEPLLNLNLALDTTLEDIREILQIEPELSGKVGLELSAKGLVNDPQTTLDLNYGGGNLAGNQIDQISLKSQLKDRILNLESLQINAASGDLNLQGEVNLQKAFPNGFLAPKRDMDAISYDLLLKENHIALQDLLKEQNIKGTVTSDISIKGKGISPKTLSAQLGLELLAEQFTASQVAPIDLHLKTQANLENGVADIRQLDLKAGDIRLQADGAFNLASETINAKLSLDAPDIAKNLSPLGIKDIAGELGLNIHASGPVKQPVFDAKIQGKQLAFQEITIGNIDLDAALDKAGTLNISKLALENQGSAINGKGRLQLFQGAFNKVNSDLPLNASISLKNIEAKDFLNKEVASGTADAQLNVEGNLNDLKAALSLKAKNLGVKATQIGDVNLDLRLDKGKIFLDQGDIQNKNSSLHLSGTAQIFQAGKGFQPLKEPTFDINLNSEGILIEDFLENLKGKVLLTAHLEGSAAHPKGTVNLEGTKLDLGAQKIESVNLVSTLDGEKALIDSLQVALAKGETLDGTGWVSLSPSGVETGRRAVSTENNGSGQRPEPTGGSGQRPEPTTVSDAFEITLTSKGISLNQIDAVREQKIADGKILIDISGKGTFANPQVKGKIALNQLRVKGKPMDDLELDVNLQDQLLKVSGTSAFDLNGFYHLEKKDFAASLLFNKTDLLPYFKLADQNDFSGKLTAKVDAKGNAGNVDQIEASLDVADLNLVFKGDELIQTQNLKAFFKNGEFSIPGALFQLLKTGKLNISGTGKPEGPLDLVITGDIPVNLLEGFVETIHETEGNLLISGTIKGTPKKPEINAKIGLKNVGMIIPGIEQKLHDVNGIIRVTPELVVVENINGELDTGRIELAGKIDLKNFQPAKADLSLNVNALPLNVPDMMDMLLNAKLQMRGTPEKSSLTGEATILEGTYYKDVNLSMLDMLKGATKKKRETSPVAPSEMTQPFLKNMTLDIIVKSRNPFMVENNLAKLDVHPDLRVYGKLNQVLLSGRAEIGSGTITYQKKEFDVKKGAIDFLNPYKIEPTLDIESEVTVRDWIIYLTVSGTPDQLNIKLSSDPAEEDGDILSLLILGKTAKELTDGSGGGASQTPAQMVAEMVAKTVGKNIKDATGLDILEVDFNNGESGDTASDSVKVTMGKNLSRRMTVKYAVESKNGEMVQRAIAEYKFLENLLLSGFQDNKGTFGAELQYRLEFR